MPTFPGSNFVLKTHARSVGVKLKPIREVFHGPRRQGSFVEMGGYMLLGLLNPDQLGQCSHKGWQRVLWKYKRRTMSHSKPPVTVIHASPHLSCRGVGEAPQLCALLGDAHPNFITETGGAPRTQSQLLCALQTPQPRAFISSSHNFKDQGLNMKFVISNKP